MLPGFLSVGASRSRGTHILIAAVCLAFITVLLIATRRDSIKTTPPAFRHSSPQQNGDTGGTKDEDGIKETDDPERPLEPPATPSEQMESDPLINDVYNRTLGFEKIFVISLPTRQDRRDSMVLAAALSEFDVEPRDGVRGDDVVDKSIPMPNPADYPDWKERLQGGVRGAWRSHMNVMQEIVNKGISSAIVMEDDGDWDVRIKDQMRDLAIASQALTQPLAQPYSRGKIKYIDPTFPDPKNVLLPVTKEFDWKSLPDTVPAKRSPYGDAWDLIWLGHCHMHLPEYADLVPKGRIVRHDDETVPEKEYLLLKLQEYEHHTRVYHHVPGTACLVAYAVTQKAAREILYQVALQPVVQAVDLGIADYCKRTGGRAKPICLTTSPALFQHYRPRGNRGAESDISGHGNDYNEKEFSEIVRWSVKLNAEEIMMGGTDYVDQYPNKHT